VARSATHSSISLDGRELERTMAGDKHAAGLLIGFLRQKSLLQRAKKRSRFANHSGYLLLGEETELPIT